MCALLLILVVSLATAAVLRGDLFTSAMPVQANPALAAEKENGLTQLRLTNEANAANKNIDKPNTHAGARLVALTFDDGPNPYITTAILDFLAEHDVVATFYVLGNLVNRHPKIVSRMAEEGHQVGNHTQTHRELPNIGAEARRWEVETARDIISKVIGHEPTTIRPPFGSTTQAVRDEFDVPNILWSVDPWDWYNRCADYVTEHVLSRTQDGCIILLHDVYHHTYEATRRIVPALLEQGFVFVTIDELLALRGEAQPGETVRSRRP